MKNDILRWYNCISFLTWTRFLTMSLLLKLSLGELEPWFILWSFFFLNLFFFKKSTKLHGVSWTSWRNRHVGSQSYIYLLFLLNTCLIIKIWLVFLIVMAGPLFFFNRLRDPSITIQKSHKDVNANSFFPHAAQIWNFKVLWGCICKPKHTTNSVATDNSPILSEIFSSIEQLSPDSLPSKCFTLIYNLSYFKTRYIRILHLWYIFIQHFSMLYFFLFIFPFF